MSDIQHLLRAATILVLVVVAYFVVRAQLIPPTFGVEGAYRASSVPEIMAKPLTYAGSESCEECHRKEFRKWRKYEHKDVACELCHGPSAEHAFSKLDPPPPVYGTNKVMAKAYDLCMSCHEIVPGRQKFPQIELVKHLAEFKITVKSPDFEASRNCLECHDSKKPEAQ